MSELTAFNAYCRANGINANGQLATEDLAPAFSAGYKARQHELRQRVQELEKQRDELLKAMIHIQQVAVLQNSALQPAQSPA